MITTYANRIMTILDILKNTGTCIIIWNMIFLFVDVIVFEKQRKNQPGSLNLDIRAALNNEGQRSRPETVPVTPVVRQKESSDSSDIQIDKTNILMLGPTGTGQF